MNRQFKFKLEKVLDIKLKREDEQRLVYSKILNEKIKIQQEIERLEYDFDKYSKLQNSSNDIFTRKIAFNYMNALLKSIQEKNELLSNIEKELESAKTELISRQSDRKAMEKLKENQYREFLDNELEEEQIENDEFSTQLYYRTQEY